MKPRLEIVENGDALCRELECTRRRLPSRAERSTTRVQCSVWSASQVARLGVLVVAALAGAAGAADDRWPGTKAGQPAPKVKGMPPELAKNLANFDDLDFRVYSGQQWQELHKSHAKDIVVHYPDGHTTKGLDAHIEELKPLFTFAPDARSPSTRSGSEPPMLRGLR